MKKFMSLLLGTLVLLISVIPVCAAGIGGDGEVTILPYMNNGQSAAPWFFIDSSGMAEVVVHYTGNSSTFTEVTVETYIQKKTLGLFWTKVDIGESNNIWVDSSTGLTGTFVHTVQLEDTGNYRAVFQITFSGTGGADDVIEDTITCSYE